ncbi:MAG: nicotinamide mononucleotide transporter [Bacteroidales bacterium]|nr:nicotinamide mononucleotide transporter [Bacteroidales bacterium]
MNDIITWISDNYIFILEIVGTILGFAYMYYEYKAKFALWPVGIVWAVCYLVIFWVQGFYAWAATWFYYLFANIYGLFAWKHEEEKQGEYKITRLKKSWRWPVILSSVLFTVPLLLFVWKFNPYVADNFADGNLAVAIILLISEAVSTSLSIVGMYLLSKKIVEQWIFWIIVNALYLIVNIYIQDWPLAVFYTAYTTMSVMGLVRWRSEAV